MASWLEIHGEQYFTATSFPFFLDPFRNLGKWVSYIADTWVVQNRFLWLEALLYHPKNDFKEVAFKTCVIYIEVPMRRTSCKGIEKKTWQEMMLFLELVPFTGEKYFKPRPYNRILVLLWSFLAFPRSSPILPVRESLPGIYLCHVSIKPPPSIEIIFET